MANKRYIVIARSDNPEIIVFVIKARSDHMALSKIERKLAEYKNAEALSIREIYNPMYDPSTAWYYEEIEVPEEAMNKYIFWDNTDLGANYFVIQ